MFVAHLGGALVAPRTLLREVRDGAPGGLGDLLWLLALQVVVVQLPRLVTAVLTLVRVSYAAGVSLLLNAVAESMLVPVVGVLGGSVVMRWLTRGAPARERNLDLAALAMIPAVCLQLAASLVVGLIGARPPRVVALAVLGVGGAWFVALAALAVWLVRAVPPAGPAPAAEPRP